MNRRAIYALLLMAVFSLPVQASPLGDARTAGQVIENPDGYIRANPAGVSADITALIKDVNSRRKAAYSKIAKKNGISVAQVAVESYKKRSKAK